MHPGSRNQAEDSRIESWKEIAAYFGRDERTVKRWEKTRSLPVHRLPGEKGGVFAYTHELTVWRNSATAEIAGPATAVVPGFGRRASDREQAPTAGLEGAAEDQFQTEDPSPIAELSAADASQLLSDEVDKAIPPNPRHRRTALVWASALAAAAILAAGLVRQLLLFRSHNTLRSLTLSAAAPVDPAARDAYLKGRYYWSHRTDGSLRQAVDAFTQAVVRDPNYAPAYAGLADSYNLMPQFSSMPRSQAFPLAISAARKAVALDDSLSEAHRALAFGLFYWDWDVNAAFREFQRAIELDPKDVDAHNWYATSLMFVRRGPAAVSEAEKARELDPTSRVVLANQAFILYWTGDKASGIARLRELEKDEPDFLSPPQYLVRIFFAERNYPAYIAELKRVAAISRDAEKAALAEAAERSWSLGGELGLLEGLRGYYKHSYETGQSSGFDLAHICALLDRKSDADRYLQAAYDAHDFEAMSSISDEINAHMAGDPAFEQLKQKIRQRMNRSPAAGPVP